MPSWRSRTCDRDSQRRKRRQVILSDNRGDVDSYAVDTNMLIVFKGDSGESGRRP